MVQRIVMLEFVGWWIIVRYRHPSGQWEVQKVHSRAPIYTFCRFYPCQLGMVGFIIGSTAHYVTMWRSHDSAFPAEEISSSLTSTRTSTTWRVWFSGALHQMNRLWTAMMCGLCPIRWATGMKIMKHGQELEHFVKKGDGHFPIERGYKDSQ